MHKIILIGMPGSGKTFTGSRLARRLRCPFVDVDQIIEAHTGQSIQAYFSQFGELAFRDLETATLRNLLADNASCVLSTGGGAVLRAENREAIKAGGVAVYLAAEPQVIYQRLRQDTKRPLLQGVDMLAKITELYQARDALYRETAHFVVDAAQSNTRALVRQIAMMLPQTGVALPLDPNKS